MGIIGCDVGISDKISTSLTPPLQLADSSDGVGLGLKMQSTESYSGTPSMMHHRPSSSPPSSQQTAAGDECGPHLGCKSIYHDESAVAGAAVTSSNSGGRAGVAAVFAQRTLQQPFDISISNSNSTTAFKSPGGIGMEATLGFPFTAAQWKELERQAMIYKHMVASVPVPYDLLLPISPNLSANPALGGGGGGSIVRQLRYSGKQDPEPGRCKRTDGKKWRCSRDVAPHQTYCERHMHRGRPRSRKHVEIQTQNPNQENSQNQTNSKKARIQNPNPNPPPPQSNNQSSFPPKVHGSTILLDESPLLLNTKNVPHISYKEPNRGLDGVMEGEMVTMDTSEQQWQQLMQHTNLGLTTEGSIHNTNQYYVEEPPLNLFSYTGFGGSQDFLSTDFVEQNPRGFIDAWSNNNLNQDDENNTTNRDTSVSSNGNLSPSSLTLSMAMGSLDGNYQKQGQVSSLMNPVSWVGSTPGGPLAEVLRPSAVALDSNPGSPYAGNGDQISPATTVSSPSGVLQRNMLSLSDSSVCNSPTLAAATARPDIVAFRWLS